MSGWRSGFGIFNSSIKRPDLDAGRNRSIMKYLFPLLFLGLLTACVDQEFDAPPVDGEDPGLTATMTIAELKAMHTFGTFTEIGEDVIIRGIVTADDRSGNLYRTFIMQDETAGIQVLVNLTNNYIYYAQGREIFIKAEGLYLGDFRGVLQLGGYLTTENGSQSLGDILDLTNTIFPGKLTDGVTPAEKTISALNDDDINTLIKLSDVQFTPLDRGQTYADAVGRSSLNRELQDCDGNPIVVRTSGFSDFAASLTPDGSGMAVGIYSTFGTTKQLLIRDTTDIMFTEALCGQGNPEDFIAISEVRDLYSGTTTAVPASKHIKGIVTSDIENANLTNRNLFLQEPNGAGIAIRFDAPHSFPMGAELDVNVGGLEVSEFNGLLQVNNVPLSRVLPIGTGSIDPQVVTIEDVLDDLEGYESELVRINGVTLSGDDYAFDTEVSDGEETIVLFGTTYSTFANTSVATNEVDLIAIVSQGGNDAVPQLIIRSLDDVVGGDHGGGGGGGGGGGNPGDPVDEVDESFDAVGNNNDVSLPGWTTVATAGTRVWRGKEFDGNVYIQATAYTDTEPSMETWTVTPLINDIGDKTLSFRSATAFYTHGGLSVLVSTDFTGDVNAATWTELDDLTLAGSAQENYAWVDSGEIDLSDFSGTGAVAFRYQGNGPGGQTNTMIVDDVVIE